MKKLLAIVVLGLLLSFNANAEQYQVKLDNCVYEDKTHKKRFSAYKHDILIDYKNDTINITAYRKPNKPYDDGSYKKDFQFKIASSGEFWSVKPFNPSIDVTYYHQINLQNNRVATVQSNNVTHFKQYNQIKIAEKPDKPEAVAKKPKPRIHN